MRRALVPLLLSCLAVWPPARAAGDAPALVLRIASADAALDDLQRLAFLDPVAEGREQRLKRWLGRLGIPAGEWLDRQRPAFVVVPREALGGGSTAWVAVAPILSLEAVWHALGQPGEDVANDAIRTIERKGRPAWHVLPGEDYVVFGPSRSAVEQVDPEELRARDWPEGGIAVDLDVATVLPLVEGAAEAQIGALRERIAELAGTEETGSADEAAARSMLEQVRFSFDTALGVLGNLSHVRLALAPSDDDVWLRARVSPAPESILGALLQAQPQRFPKLARAVPLEPALIVYASDMRFDDAFRERWAAFREGYVRTLSGAARRPAWFRELLDAQTEISLDALRCGRGDAAGLVDLDPDGGIRMIRVEGVSSEGDCAALESRTFAALERITGPDGRPLFSVTASALLHQGVEAGRVEFHAPAPDGETPDAPSALGPGALGGPGVVGYHAQLGDVAISASGPGAEDAFRDAVDRWTTRSKKGGVRAETFAPLEAGSGGFHAIVDLERLAGLPALLDPTGGDAEADEESAGDAWAGRVLFGARSEGDLLAVDVLAPAKVLARLFGPDEPELPPDLWPPPPAPAAAEGGGDDAQAADAGSDDVLPMMEGITPPEILPRSKIAPDYPEVLRLARLEGRLVLQAIIDEEGAVRETTLLSCAGKRKSDEEYRARLDLTSRFCTLLGDAGVAAVERWRYVPARRDGRPVAVYFTVRVDFALE